MAQQSQADRADEAPRGKVRVTVTHRKGKPMHEPPIPARVYPVIDTDLGRDNVENDLPAADREDLQ